MASLDELVAKLKEIFQTDRADLDFGIYRILNSRSTEINEYLGRTLPAQVKAALTDPAQEAAVYNHLLTFFTRYYDEGDFISQRRYKGNTYAIPYNGEEVMLHWANKDQYYTKSGENFSDYRFTLSDGRRVHFKLVAADTAKDNQKDLNHTRLFVLAEKQEAQYDDEGEEIRPALAPVETAADGQTLTIHFSYQPRPKGEKQDAYLSAAKKAIAEASGVQQDWAELFSRAPTEKQPDRTLLEKHLAAYTTKNSADYFIHKDLGGFLRRELDFYIKNEVMNLDNVQSAADFAPLERDLRLIQTLRQIAHKIIDFLAQLENFQKKLWLKKKFVAASHWLITLNHIPAELLEQVAANEKQLAAWKNLFAFKQLPPPLDIFFLVKTDPYLVVDTSLYPPEFQAALLTRLSEQEDFPDLDAATDGLLIHSDNFQALNLLQARYREQVKCIYIDPPYNTTNDGFIYKDNYRHSSWLSMIIDRLQFSHSLLNDHGGFFASIDDGEQDNLKKIGNSIFRPENFMTIFPWRKRTAKSDVPFGISQDYEYIVAFAKSDNFLAHTEGKERKYFTTNDYPDRPWRIHDLTTQRNAEERPNSFFTMINPKNGKEYPANPIRTWAVAIDTFQEYYDAGKIVFPDDYDFLNIKNPVMRYFKDDDMAKAGENFGRVAVSTKFPDKVGMSQDGTKEVTALFGNKAFSFPKPTSLISFIIETNTKGNDLILDYFAGSGTTAHAVINLNREDGGKRKYILVEQAEYFNTVLKPRVQKVIYSKEWKDGKPHADGDGNFHGVPQIVKVLKLESYEDTLNNLQLHKPDLLAHTLSKQSAQDYLLHYMIDIESRDSLLSSDDFRKPFDYRLNIASDSAGAYTPQLIDLVETFNYLLGLRVDAVEDRRHDKGYVFIEGYLDGERVLLLWRDCECWDYDGLQRLLEKKKIKPQDSEFAAIYINGDHTLPTVWQDNDADGGSARTLKIRSIEAEFLRLMFAEAE
ncbi:site-specific DNA-methyltransferase [uncultured Cardiobacterium sp.]|uniref:site-specific DNA-methyltransferase n=1 Tax=uncultured Cardiobacterium sp. TaxID=417619 RepID=UPI0026379D82|nr:site-specific DNA-methyltransferase [uncultured Cardiobacterium sp.]